MSDDPTMSNGIFRPVFILGAGFSRAISGSMPTADELGKEVVGRLGENRPPPTLTRGGFEEWLSRLAEDQPDLLEHENLLRRHYFSIVARFVAIAIEDAESGVAAQVGWVQGWLQRFLGVAHAQRGTLLTFNYDTLIERAVDRSFFRDLSAWSDRMIHSCDVLGHLPPRVDLVEGGPHETFRLLKLHGSTSFYWVPNDPTGATLVRWPLPQECHDLGPSVGRATHDLLAGVEPRFEMATASEEDPEKRRLLHGREPLIVPPSALKSRYYGVPFLRGLWQQSREAITRATHLYLVGYSLPTTDLVTLGLLRENLSPECQIVVVNEGEDKHEVVERCRVQLAGPASAEVNGPIGIEEWVKGLVEQRSRQVSADLARCLAVEAGGEKTKAADSLVRVQVYRADQVGYEVAEQSESGAVNEGIRLSVKVGRPIHMEPRWKLEELTEFVQRVSNGAGGLACQYADGSAGIIVTARLTKPPRSAEYSVTCESIPQA